MQWQGWLARFGHDDFAWPWFITRQISTCRCMPASENLANCSELVHGSWQPVSWRDAVRKDHDALLGGGHAGRDGALTYCVSLAWLLEHMPPWDANFLPPSVVGNGSSMLEDNIAFALMADRATPWARSYPLGVKLGYLLPYASYHESRQNWRPLFFAKYFPVVAGATSATEALSRLIAPNRFLNWSGLALPGEAASAGYSLKWQSSTSPPVIAPLDFVAYGKGSCTAWATLLTYILRAVGIPARQVGTPCWNSVFQGIDYRSLATQNPNVSSCWQASRTPNLPTLSFFPESSHAFFGGGASREAAMASVGPT
jgi:hypothetical protein